MSLTNANKLEMVTAREVIWVQFSSHNERAWFIIYANLAWNGNCIDIAFHRTLSHNVFPKKASGKTENWHINSKT